MFIGNRIIFVKIALDILIMKRILFCLFFIGVIFTAKGQFEMEGRVFYDSLQQDLREVYHYYLRYSVRIDRTTGDTIINPTPTTIRHGACILYRRDGTIEATGQYKDGKKSGKWFFYDKKGKAIIDEKMMD